MATSSHDKEKRRIIGAETVRQVCMLSNGKYNVSIKGVYENPDPAGHCGNHVTAELVIRKAQTKIYSGTFEGGCDSAFSSDVITEVSVTSGAQSAEVKKTRGSDFYK